MLTFFSPSPRRPNPPQLQLSSYTWCWGVYFIRQHPPSSHTPLHPLHISSLLPPSPPIPPHSPMHPASFHIPLQPLHSLSPETSRAERAASGLCFGGLGQAGPTKPWARTNCCFQKGTADLHLPCRYGAEDQGKATAPQAARHPLTTPAPRLVHSWQSKQTCTFTSVYTPYHQS